MVYFKDHEDASHSLLLDEGISINDFNNTISLEGASLPVGTTTIKWTVSDAAGNEAECSFDVLVKGVTITNQPSDQADVCLGDDVNFSIDAENTDSYQWQVSTDGGANYNNLANGAPYAGVTTPTLTVTGVTAGLSGYAPHSIKGYHVSRFVIYFRHYIST